MPGLTISDSSHVTALQRPSAAGATRDALGVGVAGFLLVEEHPLVSISHPPQLAPELVPLLARMIERNHQPPPCRLHPSDSITDVTISMERAANLDPSEQDQ